MKRPETKAFSAQVKYDFTRQELEDIIRKHTGFQDGQIEWDISNKGTLRGATIKVIRTEIQG